MAQAPGPLSQGTAIETVYCGTRNCLSRGLITDARPLSFVRIYNTEYRHRGLHRLGNREPGWPDRKAAKLKADGFYRCDELLGLSLAGTVLAPRFTIPHLS